MKSKILVGLLAIFLVVAFASCDFAGTSMTGTNWVTDKDTGVGLKFTTATTGTTTLGALGIWTDVTAFTYTYDSALKSGVITTSSGSPFTISGNKLSFVTLTYTYKP